MKRYRFGLISLVFVVLPAALCPSFAQAAVERKKFSADGRYLIVEFLDDDLVHIEVSAVGEGPDASEMLYASPMVHKRDYEGPGLYADLGNVLETQEIRLEVDLSTLAITVRDKTRSNALLTSLSPEDLANAFKKIRITRGSIEHVYGLGQQFKIRGSSDGDWTQLGVREGEAFGNGFVGFQQAAVGNVQIPVMYAVGDNNLNYAMFLDNPYKQRWDFTAPSWNVQMFGDQIRFYLMTGITSS